MNKYLICMCFILLNVGYAGSTIFKSPYITLPPGRVIKLPFNEKIPNNTSFQVSDTNIVQIEGMFLRAKKIGGVKLSALQNGVIIDTATVMVTQWVSGFSSLDIIDTLKNLVLIGYARDSIYAYPTTGGNGWRGLYYVNANFLEKKLLNNFNLVPTSMVCGSTSKVVLVAKNPSIPSSSASLFRSSNLFSWQTVMDTFPNASYSAPPTSYFLYQGAAMDSVGNAYIAEYNAQDSAYPNLAVRIFKSTNFGNTWKTAYQFPPRSVSGPSGGVRHIHALQIDPYTGNIWIGTGDKNDQSRIYYHTNKLLPGNSGQVELNLVGTGSQEWRVVSFSFTKDYIYWYMDAPSVIQRVFRVKRRASYPTITSAANDYRELVANVKDKALWYNTSYINGPDSLILFESAYELDYNPQIDKRVRIFAIKEYPELQCQEVISVPSFGSYSHIYVRGQLSNGNLLLSTDNAMFPGYHIMRSRVNFKNVSKALYDSSQVYTIRFPNLNLRLQSSERPNGDVFGVEQQLSDLPSPIPSGYQFTSGTKCFEVYSTASSIKNALVAMKSSSVFIGADSTMLRCLFFNTQTKAWEVLGAFMKNDSIYAKKTINNFGWLVIGKVDPFGTKPRPLGDPIIPFVKHTYPNPTNGIVVIGYSLGANSDVRIELSNILGENVSVIRAEHQSMGDHEFRWSIPQNLPSGVYYIRYAIKPENGKSYNEFRKLLYLK